MELLLRHDHVEVIATGRQPAQLVDLAARGARIRDADPDDAASLDAAFTGAHRLLLLPGAADGLWSRRRQLPAMVDAAARVGVRTVVYTAQVDAFDPSLMAVERECEVVAKACAAHDLALTILHVGWPVERLFARIAMALRRGKWWTSAPQGQLPYVASEDVARTVAAVLRADSRLPDQLAITGPRTVTAEALVHSINTIFGASVDAVPVSSDTLAEHLQASGFSKAALREAMVMDAVSQRGPAQLPSEAVEQMTGQPPRSVEAVLAEHRLDLLLSSCTPRL
ncbi:NADPH:quinone oxidoreductase 2 |uniref:NADPH:quinone oxidoreductase 2 \